MPDLKDRILEWEVEFARRGGDESEQLVVRVLGSLIMDAITAGWHSLRFEAGQDPDAWMIARVEALGSVGELADA